MAIFSAIAAALAGTAATGTAAAGAGAVATGAATGVGGIAGAVGTAATIAGGVMQYSGQKEAAAGAERAERLREAQSEMEGNRQRRQIVRQAVLARSEALTNANSQGASAGSGLQGGVGQIQGQAGGALVGSAQNQELGRGMFAANRQIAAGQTTASTGGGVSSLGGALVKNQEAIGRLGAYAFG